MKRQPKLLAVSLIHDAYVWMNPVKPLFFISDGKGFTRPLTPVDSPIIGDTELLEETDTRLAGQSPFSRNANCFFVGRQCRCDRVMGPDISQTREDRDDLNRGW